MITLYFSKELYNVNLLGIFRYRILPKDFVQLICLFLFQIENWFVVHIHPGASFRVINKIIFLPL